MKNKASSGHIIALFIIAAIVLLTFAISVYFYPNMPSQVASHWGINGEVNGYMSRFWGVFLLPIISFGMALLFMLIPLIDPLKANIDKFRKHYNTFIIILMVFMLLVQLQILLWNTGIRISPNLFLPFCLGALFFYTGILLKHAKRNYFIGIRTPWTLSSDVVWDKTHRMGGNLFMAAGMISFLGILAPAYSFWLIIIPILVVSMLTVVYSYLEYRKLKKK